ncbi:hypothetical protein LPJ61_005134, partial [Coemansia biformis]
LEGGDDDEDGMEDTLALVLSQWRSSSGEGLQLDNVWSVYEHQRRVHLKHKKLAERAAEEMHRAAKMMQQMTRRYELRPPGVHRPDPDLASSTERGVAELLSNNKAARPFQFATTLRSAFRLKPRAAFACHFEGMEETVSVAYGMDGTVQLWDPQAREQIQVLTKDQLGVDFAEHMTQATPSLLAAVSGARSTACSLENQGRLMFIGRKPLSVRRENISLGAAQHWHAPAHDGFVSVVEGMMGGRAGGDHERGMMVSGGVSDRKVLVWSLRVSGSQVTKADVVQQMQTRHGSRVTALCYEPCYARVLSGSESGRISINDAETGQSATTAGSDDRLQNRVIGSIAICPTSPHLVMASCAQPGSQIRIMDMRQRQSVAQPALAFGLDTGRTQSRYARPAWHPAGGLVFCPFRCGLSGDGVVAIWDTRYARCADDAPQTYQPHKATVWSVSFAGQDRAGKTTMVTVSGDHNIGFTDFRI